MPRITPHLWFDKEAVEATKFYAETFPDGRIHDVSQLHDTPSGDVDVVSYELMGQSFQAISAGPMFRFTPAISFMVACATRDDVDALWGRLSEGGNVMMPLDAYPFSERYGWTEDRYGVSWQVTLDGSGEAGQAITPALMFTDDLCGKAEEAVEHYTSVFPDSKVGPLLRYAEGQEPDRPGTIQYAGFTLGGQAFSAMDSARVQDSGFNEAISLIVPCETQDEIDYYWERLSAVPESEQCGWLKDRFGVSWQIVPTALGELMSGGTEEQTARVTEAFLQMKKFDIAGLRRAFDGADA